MRIFLSSSIDAFNSRLLALDKYSSQAYFNSSYNKYMEELQVYLNQINLREFSQSRRLKYSLDELLIDELSID